MRWLMLLGVLVALLGWFVLATLAPNDYAIDRSVFRNPAKAAEPVANQVKPTPDGEAPRPNLIVILADDLGYGDLGVQGSRAIATPQMDRLARNGMRFTQFYASAPVCSPSRAGLLTGRYPLRSGIITALQAAGDSLPRRLTLRAAMALAKLGAVDMPGGERRAGPAAVGDHHGRGARAGGLPHHGDRQVASRRLHRCCRSTTRRTTASTASSASTCRTTTGPWPSGSTRRKW